MNNIQMIPIGDLIHHPENPRKDLGDLSELTESIRKNGVMQNLTVVADLEKAKYLVVIGNRRMEAAKAAGLIELPCVISDMDHRTQIATMLEENMQREDLTVYEQAQGFQMMMDLGFKPEEISEKTGFSETTVRRRLKMAEMDPKLLKKACEAKETERQITLFDFERLAQVESIKERNELLKDIGETNFDWRLNRKLREQRAKAVKNDALKELKEAGIIRMKENEEYSSKYERLYNENVDLADWKPGKKMIPKSKEQLYYFLNGDTVKFYTKAKPAEKAKPVQKTEAEKQKEAKIENAWKIVDRITLNAQELRCEFVDGLTVKPSNAMQMLRWTIIAAMSDMLDHNYNNYTGIKNIFELEGTYRWDLVDGIEKKIMDMDQSDWPALIQCMFEGWSESQKDAEKFACGSRREFPKWQRNTRLEQCYKWLTEFGYQMSTEEIEMMGGTHQVFQTEIKTQEAEA